VREGQERGEGRGPTSWARGEWRGKGKKLRPGGVRETDAHVLFTTRAVAYTKEHDNNKDRPTK